MMAIHAMQRRHFLASNLFSSVDHLTTATVAGCTVKTITLRPIILTLNAVTALNYACARLDDMA